MSSSNTPTPPLLLTKRLSAFLHSHQSPQLPTLLLITAHGKLLAHASSLSVALLRIHATVAASLLAIHTSSSVAIPSALPGSRAASPSDQHGSNTSPDINIDASRNKSSEEQDEDEDEDEDGAGSAAEGGGDSGSAIQPGTITVQLTGGTVVIRRLDCGLLFVCVGPAAQGDGGSEGGGGDGFGHGHGHGAGQYTGSNSASPSEAGSLMSAGAGGSASGESVGGAVGVMRRRAGELARRLDEKLGTLKVPGEGVGIEVV